MTDIIFLKYDKIILQTIKNKMTNFTSLFAANEFRHHHITLFCKFTETYNTFNSIVYCCF